MAISQSTELFYLDGRRGVRLACFCWHPRVQSGPVVAFAHGYTAYAQRYINVIDALVDAGFVVFAVDHRGHGSSAGKRASLDRFDDLVDDFERLISVAQSRFDGRPVFTFGHSMGGLMVARQAISSQGRVRGTVSTSPAFIVGENAGHWKTQMLLLLSRIVPNAPVIGPGNSNSVLEGLSGRAEPADLYSYHGKTRLNLAREIWLAGRATLDKAGELSSPILLQHGSVDPVTAPEGSHVYYQRAASTDKTLAIWRDREHNLLTDKGWEDVTAQAIGWIGERS